MTTRIKRLLEVLISYSFNLYHIRVEGMILSDYLSRQKHGNSNLHEIIPISYNMQNVLHTKYNVNEREQGKYLVQTRSQAKASGIILPEIHGIDKGKEPNVRPEKQITKPVVILQTHILSDTKTISHIKPRIGQGRAGLKRSMLISVKTRTS